MSVFPLPLPGLRVSSMRRSLSAILYLRLLPGVWSVHYGLFPPSFSLSDRSPAAFWPPFLGLTHDFSLSSSPTSRRLYEFSPFLSHSSLLYTLSTIRGRRLHRRFLASGLPPLFPLFYYYRPFFYTLYDFFYRPSSPSTPPLCDFHTHIRPPALYDYSLPLYGYFTRFLISLFDYPIEFFPLAFYVSPLSKYPALGYLHAISRFISLSLPSPSTESDDLESDSLPLSDVGGSSPPFSTSPVDTDYPLFYLPHDDYLTSEFQYDYDFPVILPAPLFSPSTYHIDFPIHTLSHPLSNQPTPSLLLSYNDYFRTPHTLSLTALSFYALRRKFNSTLKIGDLLETLSPHADPLEFSEYLIKKFHRECRITSGKNLQNPLNPPARPYMTYYDLYTVPRNHWWQLKPDLHIVIDLSQAPLPTLLEILGRDWNWENFLESENFSEIFSDSKNFSEWEKFSDEKIFSFPEFFSHIYISPDHRFYYYQLTSYSARQFLMYYLYYLNSPYSYESPEDFMPYVNPSHYYVYIRGENAIPYLKSQRTISLPLLQRIRPTDTFKPYFTSSPRTFIPEGFSFYPENRTDLMFDNMPDIDGTLDFLSYHYFRYFIAPLNLIFPNAPSPPPIGYTYNLLVPQDFPLLHKRFYKEVITPPYATEDFTRMTSIYPLLNPD